MATKSKLDTVTKAFREEAFNVSWERSEKLWDSLSAKPSKSGRKEKLEELIFELDICQPGKESVANLVGYLEGLDINVKDGRYKKSPTGIFLKMTSIPSKFLTTYKLKSPMLIVEGGRAMEINKKGGVQVGSYVPDNRYYDNGEFFARLKKSEAKKLFDRMTVMQAAAVSTGAFDKLFYL